MDIETSKENIQPLRGGRNVERLGVALNAESQQDLLKELSHQRKIFEDQITNYSGEDPLGLWYEYIGWIEQSYPKGGKESKEDEILSKCIETFESNPKYNQDRRLIKLYIKYIDAQPNPTPFYQELWNLGIGTMCAELYMAWAYYYDIADNFHKTEEIYRKGLDAGAKPIDELEQAHRHFCFSMSQRMLYKDDNSKQKFIDSMEEKRNALTRLKPHKKKHVGSIRTGIAVKSHTPGVVNQENIPNNFIGNPKSDSIASQILIDGASSHSSAIQQKPSIIRSIIDNARERENTHEPGPWNKAKIGNRKSVLFAPCTSNTPFSIMVDNEENETSPIPAIVQNFDKGIILPPNHKRVNEPQRVFTVPIVESEDSKANSIPMYDKISLYCNRHGDFSPEELRAYKYFKRINVNNTLTKRMDHFWVNEYEVGIRLYPGYDKQNVPQTKFECETYVSNESITNENYKMMIPIDKIFPRDCKEEFSIEEIRVQQWKEGKIKTHVDKREISDVQEMDMDETIIGNRRESIAPPRISMLPRPSILPRKSVLMLKPNISDIHEEEMSEIDETAEISRKSITNKRKLELCEQEVEMTAKNKNTCETPPRALFMPSPPVETDPFVIPAPPTGTKPKYTIPIFIDDEPDKYETNQNDSCSTQQFNMFVKSVSTPLKEKPIQNDENVEPTPGEISPAPMNDENTDLEPEIAQGGAIVKQLSTIMETTESNTISTVCSTKSSVDTQVISPEIDDFDSKIKDYTKNSSKLSMHGDNKSIRSIASLIAFKIHEDVDDELPPENTQKNTQLTRKHFEENPITVEMPSMMSFKVPEERTETVHRMIIKPEPASRIFPKEVTFSEQQATSASILLSQKEHEMSEMMSFKIPDEITMPNIINKSMENVIEPISSNSHQLASFEIKDDEEEKSTETIKNIPENIMQQNDNEMFSMMAFKTEKASFDMNNLPFQIHIDSTETMSLIPIIQKQIVAENQKTDNMKENENILHEPESMKSFNLPEDRTAPVRVPSILQKEMSRESDEFDIFTKTPEKSKNISKDYVTRNCGTSKQYNNDTFGLPSFQEVERPFERNDSAFEIPFWPLPAATENKSNCDFINFTKTIKQEPSLNIEPSYQTMPVNDIDYDICNQLNRSSLDDINTVKFQFNLKDAQNSTLLPSRATLDFQDNTKNLMGEISEAKTNPMDQTKLSDLHLTIPISLGELENIQPKVMEKEAVQFKIPQPLVYRSIELEPKFDEQEEEVEDDFGKSIYVFNEPKEEPQDTCEYWEEIDDDFNPANNTYAPKVVDLETTKQILDVHSSLEILDPFNLELKAALLEEVQFYHYIENLDDASSICELVNKVAPIKKGEVITIKGNNFDVIKQIGKGTFGTIYSGISRKNNQTVALKQERPANCWEYYICLEIKTRIEYEDILAGFLGANYALIGHNASILVSTFSKHGTILDVCNKIKQHTNKNMDEYIAMIITCQILSVIDHLHSIEIIHADVKPDNILIMESINLGSKVPMIQLIDFGVAIDMRLFPPNTTFKKVVHTDGFTCTEMLENKPWTYQTDLFGIAGSAHVMLFGKYMEVQKDIVRWNIKSRLPRYFKRSLWENFFSTLLNVRNCREMPNLQRLRSQFLEEIYSNEKFTQAKISEFNHILQN